MADLKTNLELNIKPFLDAIQKAANSLKILGEIKPNFNTSEFTKLQSEFNKFKPEINVALKVDSKELGDTKTQIASIDEEPIDLQILINSEEVQRSVNRVQELRSTVLNIPKLTDIKLDSNTDEETFKLDELRETAQKLADAYSSGDFDIKLNSKQLSSAIEFAEDDLKSLGKTLADVPDFTFDLKGVQKAEEFFTKFNNILFEVNKNQIREIFPNLEKENQKVFQSVLGYRDLNDIIDTIQRKSKDLGFNVEIDKDAKIEAFKIRESLLQVPKTVTTKYNINGDENVVKTANIVNNALGTIPPTKFTTVDIVGEQNVIYQANKIEKEIRDIPTSKNINVNIDKNAVGKIKGVTGAATGAVSGFGKQLSSGLLASFSGAAIGAALAQFAVQAVRSIGTAIKSADSLSDSLRLAFTQVGIQDLDGALARANAFALDLSTNFGISAETSKTLLAQVVGLTGEFGTASENITKAAIGIEAATGGLVKAEQAAKLFSRSLGNPEDQAALDTLAKRFPALGDAINSTADPAERANAVLLNLTGTFDALNVDSNDLFSTLQRLGDTFSNVFGTAFAPIADAIAPTFQAISDSLLGSTESIGKFGQDIVEKFINPLIAEFDNIGPFFGKFLDGLSPLLGVLGSISFDILITGLQILAPLLGAVGDIVLALSPILTQLGDLVSGILAPVFQLFNNELYNSLDPTKQLTDNVFSLNPVIETLSNLVDLLYPLINLLGHVIIDLLIPALQGLEYTLGIVLLPFRALNFAFDVGKQFVADYSAEIATLTSYVQAFLFLIPPLFVASKVLGAIAGYASKPLVFKADLGDLSEIGKIPADAFGEQADAARNFNDQYGINLPKAVGKGTKSIKIATGATKENKTAISESLAELDKLAKAYEELSKRIENRYVLELNNINLRAKTAEAINGGELNDYKKIGIELDKINLLDKKRIDLQTQLNDVYKLNSKDLKASVDQYLGLVETADAKLPILDPSAFGIKFDPTDAKSVEAARKVAEEILALYNEQLKSETQRQEFQIELNKLNVKFDEQSLNFQLSKVGQSVSDGLRSLETGKISVAEFDIDALKASLNKVKDAATVGLQPFKDQLQSLSSEIELTQSRLRLIADVSGTNSKVFKENENSLRLLVSQYSQLIQKTKTYTDTIEEVDTTIQNFGETLDDSITKKFEALQKQDFEFKLQINTSKLQQGLADIDRTTKEALLQLQKDYETTLAEIKNLGKVTPEIESGLAEKYKEDAKNLRVNARIAKDEFRKQTDALYAIQQSFIKNIGSITNPNTLEAKGELDKKTKEINSELDLLRAKQQIENDLNKGTLNERSSDYEEYTTKILELEKQKNDALKVYDDEVNRLKLEGLQRIADESLPAIQDQLKVANAELTDLLLEGAGGFEAIANQTLETIGLVALESLAVAVAQAKSFEEIQKLFLKNVVQGLLQVLQAQLTAVLLEVLFNEVKEKSFLGIATAAVLGGVLAAGFAVVQAKLLSQIDGFSEGGYTGNANTSAVAGVVHGQEFVINAESTKRNREALEYLNSGGNLKDFFKGEMTQMDLVDTKDMSNSINTLAYTMDSRLSSLETTVDRAIRQSSTTMRSQNSVDVSVYSDPGTTIKHMKKIGKIKGLS